MIFPMAVKLRDMNSDPAEKAVQVQERKFLRAFLEYGELLAGKGQRAAGRQVHDNGGCRRTETAQMSAIVPAAGSVTRKRSQRSQCRARAKDKADFFADQLLKRINHNSPEWSG